MSGFPPRAEAGRLAQTGPSSGHKTAAMLFAEAKQCHEDGGPELARFKLRSALRLTANPDHFIAMGQEHDLAELAQAVLDEEKPRFVETSLGPERLLPGETGFPQIRGLDLHDPRMPMPPQRVRIGLAGR